MSWNTDFSATLLIPHPPTAIAGTLVDAERLPEWNPAFTHVGTRREDGTHPLVVHGILRGVLTCHPSGDKVRFGITIPGLTEHSVFIMEPGRDGTVVTHRVQQRGALSSVIGAREVALVPHKRLSRLAETLNHGQ